MYTTLNVDSFGNIEIDSGAEISVRVFLIETRTCAQQTNRFLRAVGQRVIQTQRPAGRHQIIVCRYSLKVPACTSAIPISPKATAKWL